MKITFKPYIRRDGQLMLYLNRSNGKSVGLSGPGWSPYAKGVSEGDRNTFNAAAAVFKAHAQPFSGSAAAHPELKAECGMWDVLVTDVGSIGGVQVSQDGAYLVRDGLILRCGTYDESCMAAAGDDS